jgi:DNA-binding PadR family transcriptional regulator
VSDIVLSEQRGHALVLLSLMEAEGLVFVSEKDGKGAWSISDKGAAWAAEQKVEGLAYMMVAFENSLATSDLTL